MTKLTISPTQATYSYTDGVEAVGVQFDGPAGLHGPFIQGAAATVDVAWNVADATFEDLLDFYRLHGQRGLPFLIDLIFETGAPVEHTAYFIPGSLQVTSLDGPVFEVKAQLEVLPLRLVGPASVASTDDVAAQATVNAYVRRIPK